jgi:Domain of unknown function (DUF5655)
VVTGEEDGALERFFDGFPDGLRLYDAVAEAVADIGEASVRVTRSQVAFRRRTGFAFVWRPGQYVTSDVPAVLSIALPHEVVSDRFKSVVHPSTRVWMHHLELREVEQVDDEVRGWLVEAYDNAG